MGSVIQIKRGTGSAVPTSLADGELALNIDSGSLFYGSGSAVLNSFSFTNITASGNIATNIITVDGDINAKGNIIGDGQVAVSGIKQINANNFISGSTLIAENHIFSKNHITASGNISSSGRIFANLAAGTDNSVVVLSNGQLVTDEAQASIFGSDPILTQELEIEAPNLIAGIASNVAAVSTSDNAEFFVALLDGASGTQVVETSARLKLNPNTGNLNVFGNISASGEISASSFFTRTGSIGKIKIGDTDVTTLSSDIHIRNQDGSTFTLESMANNNQIINFNNNQSPDFSIGNYHSDGGLQIRSTDKTFITVGASDGDEVKVSGSLNVTSNVTAPSYTGQVIALDRASYYVTIDSTNYFHGRNTGVESGDLTEEATTPFVLDDEDVYSAIILPVSCSSIGFRGGVRVSGGGTLQCWISTGSRGDWQTANTVNLGFGGSGSATVASGQDFGALDVDEFSIGSECDAIYVFFRCPDGDSPTVRINGQVYGRTS